MKKVFTLIAVLLISLSAFSQTSWPDSIYTASSASYLTEQEKAVIVEMNKARTNPKRYAEEVLVPFKNQFIDSENSYIFINYQGIRILTREGVSAVDECIKVLKNAKPTGTIKPSEGMSLAAADHVKDQGKSGKVGHNGANGSRPWDRISRYGKWLGSCGENIDYGNDNGQAVVVSLLVDDGVASRGHRENILSSAFGAAGVAIGVHKSYRNMCVITYASGYIEK